MKTSRIATLLLAGGAMISIATIVPIVSGGTSSASGRPYNVVEDELNIPDNAEARTQFAIAFAAAAAKSDPEYLRLQHEVSAAEDELYATVARDSRMKPIQDAWVECMGGRFASDAELFTYADGILFPSGTVPSPEEDAANRAQVAELYAANDACAAPMSADFDQIVRQHAKDWKASHQDLFTAYAASVGLPG